jgi:hypothetical protein
MNENVYVNLRLQMVSGYHPRVGLDARSTVLSPSLTCHETYTSDAVLLDVHRHC